MANKGAQLTGFDEIFAAAKIQKRQEYAPYLPVDFGVIPVYQVSVKPLMKWENGKPTNELELTEEGHAKVYRELSLGEPNGKHRFRFVDEFKTETEAKSAIAMNGKQVEFINPMVLPNTRQKASKSGFVSDVYSWSFACHGVKEYVNPDVSEQDKD